MSQSQDFWAEIDRMRRIIPTEADRHLENWAQWIRAYREVRGYSNRSLVVSSGGASQDFDELCRSVDVMTAQIADAVIDALPIHCRQAIAQVYISDTPILRRSTEADLIAGACEFWARAQRKGLV